MKIGLDIDTRSLMKKVEAVKKKAIPYAVSTANTLTAKDAKAALQREMKDVFDQPTPFVLNSIYITPSTVKTLYAEIWIKNQGQDGRRMLHTLSPHIYGGARNIKASETAIARVAAQAKRSPRLGDILSGENFLSIGSAAKKDRYGNIPRGQMTAILASLKAFTKEGFDSNETGKSRKRRRSGSVPKAEYFVGSPGGGKLPFGVWARHSFAMGSAVKPILIGVDRPAYESKRFDFFFVVELTHRRVWVKHFTAALRKMMDKIEREGLR